MRVLTKCLIPKCEQVAEPGRDRCGYHQPELPGMSIATNGVPLDFSGLAITPSDKPAVPPLDFSDPDPDLSEREPDHLDGPDGLHLTPVGNAARFIRDHGNDLKWVEGRNVNSAGCWYCWDGQRWRLDNVKAMQLAKVTVSKLSELVTRGVDAGYDPNAVTKLVKFWGSSERDHMINEMMRSARWDVAIKQGQFDADPDLLGVENGVVDLHGGTLRPANRADLITKQANARFDESATCPLWEQFLLDTTQRNHDLIAYLQMCAGISLTGHTKEHAFFIIIGPGGTGKTTYCETLKYVWGDYCIGIDPNSLASMRAEGGKARPDIAKLPGVRLVLANETRKGLQLDSGLIKALTGGDTATARYLYHGEFDFKPTHKLWLRTNEEPQFDGADTGMARRVKKISFTNVVKTQDVDLPEKLKAEAAGILKWAVRGWLAYQKHGLIEPAIVSTETADYIRSLDVLAQFIEEECQVDPSFRQASGELYQRYRIWIDRRGQKPVGSPRFKSDLKAKGFKHLEDRNGPAIWYGLQLKK